MDKNFRDLLTRFLNGTCTPEERDQVNEWYETIADNNLEIDEEEKSLIEARMLANILNAAGEDRFDDRRRFMLTTGFYKAAAAVLLLAVCGLWVFGPDGLLTVSTDEYVASATTDVVYNNTSDEASVHQLPDGSTVRLEPSGCLRFTKDFSVGDREVYLTGKAFFDIVKDSSRPFYVYSGKIATRVLGTSFIVDAPSDAAKVGVKVITGKVSVFQVKDDRHPKESASAGPKNSTANGVVLSPNQKVEYYVEGGHWVTGLVEDPVPVKSIDVEKLSFVFSNTSVRKVLADINERFGIEVVTESESILRCAFTGDVSRMSLYDMLDVISNSIGSTYEVKGTRILVSGKGCDDVSAEKVYK